jgi:DNA repair exonuclease SbcCD ATPase subunit
MLKNIVLKNIVLKKLLFLSLCISTMIPLVTHASLLHRADENLDAQDRAAKYQEIYSLTQRAIAHRKELKAELQNILATAARPEEVVRKLNALKTRVNANYQEAAKNINKLKKEIEEYDRELVEEYAQARKDEEMQKKQSYASQAWAWATRKEEIEPTPSPTSISREYELRVPDLLEELDTLTTTDLPKLLNALRAKFNNNSPDIVSAYDSLWNAYKRLENAREQLLHLEREKLDVANAEISNF